MALFSARENGSPELWSVFPEDRKNVARSTGDYPGKATVREGPRRRRRRGENTLWQWGCNIIYYYVCVVPLLW